MSASRLESLRLTFWRLDVCEELGSTQDELIARAQSGEPEGLAILARRQTAGRGQFGRVWVAPRGNLNLSVLLRPGTALRDAPQWSLAVGVAAAEALAPFVPGLRLKYPNDLMLDGRKLGGILVDSAADGARLAWLVIGIGINIAEAPVLAEQPTIALAERGVTIEPEALARLILGRIEHWYGIVAGQGFAPVRAAWLALAADPTGGQAQFEAFDRRSAG